MKTELLGTSWTPKKGGLPWKVTDVFTSHYNCDAVKIEKYQGGRNSPAIITFKKLKQNFNQN
jgi:hypothetical protein